MPSTLGFNSKRLNSTNRSITLGSMIVSQNVSSKRIYNWNKTNAQCLSNDFECIWGIKRGQWGPPTTPFSHRHPYYSTNMYNYNNTSPAPAPAPVSAPAPAPAPAPGPGWGGVVTV